MDFLIKFTGCFGLSVMISVLAGFFYLCISSILVDYFRLNYRREGAYWTFNYVIGLTLLTWVISFAYLIKHLK